MRSSLLVLGPFIGDFETEINLFRPYMKWISEIINYDKVYISTHCNRSFLYDWIKTENIIPVYENLSRDELLQKGIVNTFLSQRDYIIIQRKLLSQIISQYGKNKPIIYNFFLNYTNRNIHYPYYKRIYNKILSTHFLEKNDIVFIPDMRESKEKTEILYNELIKKYDISVVGDMKTHLSEENIALKRIDYFENGYKYIIDKITNAKVVICPLSHWTFISKLQGTPVISWITKGSNKYTSIRKTSECNVLNDYKANNILDTIDYFIEENT